MDVKKKFLELTSETYPHPSEEGVLKFLPSLKQDAFGNYYTIIGESDTMFACHLDTADHKKSKVNHKFFVDEKGKHSPLEGDEWIYTDGSTILGADDKAGTVVMLYMMEKQVPGIYYFFIGEERGCIGSSALADAWGSEATKHVDHVQKVISFDRRGFASIISNQMGLTCASDAFVTALSKAYSQHGLTLYDDPTGIYTDSASFMDLVPECTNISVGYFDEHSGKERQNISFLERLCEATAKIDWSKIPVGREIGISDQYLEQYPDFMTEIQKLETYNDFKIFTEDSLLCMVLTVEESSVWWLHKEVAAISNLIEKYNLQHMHWIELAGNTIKIYLA